jgi:hypothetical protein
MFLSDIVGDLSIEEVENSLRKVSESTDEMFAPSKNEREYQLLDNSSLIKLYKQTAKFARGRPANQKSLGQIAVELNRRGYPEPDTMLKHLYGKVKSAIKENDDDMFASASNISADAEQNIKLKTTVVDLPTQGLKDYYQVLANDLTPSRQESFGTIKSLIANELVRRGEQVPQDTVTETDDMFSNEPRHFQRLGTSIENYGEGYLEMGRDVRYSQDEAVHEYAGDLIRNGKAMLAAGAAFQKGMQAGLVQWVLVDRDVREDYYNYCREVENWDAEALINEHVGLTEEDDMFAKRPEVSKHNQPFVNKPIIGSAKVRDDIDTAWDWGDDYQVDSIDELPHYEQKMIRSAGKTLPVVNLSDRGYLTVLLGPQQPFTLHVHFFRDIRVDHPTAVNESVDSELVIRISKVLKQKGYAVEQLISPSVVSTGLEHAVSLYKQWSNLTPDAQWNLLDDISGMMTNP